MCSQLQIRRVFGFSVCMRKLYNIFNGCMVAWCLSEKYEELPVFNVKSGFSLVTAQFLEREKNVGGGGEG